jgi:hypothetical protein
MTDNSNNSGWVTTSGETQSTGSNLLNIETSREPQAVVGKGGIEINGSGPVHRHAPAAYVSGQEAPADETIMGTVKASHGGQLIDRVPNGRDLVSIGGMQTTIDAAVASGFLVRNQDGSFSDKAAPVKLRNPVAEAEATKPAEKEDTKKGIENALNLSSETTDALTKIATTAMQGDTIKAMDSIILNGDVDKNTLSRIASQMSIEPEDAQALLAQAAHGFYEAAEDLLGAGGIDSEAFSAFANSDPANAAKLAEASRALVMTNDTAGLKEMATSFYESADKFMPEETRQALTDAGFDYRDGPDGLKVMVNGVPVSFNVAVKQQIIKFI